MRCDVAVVGAGPAGSVTAALLAESGLRVTVLEREGIPRVKPCGGGLTLKTWNLLRELGFRVEGIPRVKKISRIRLIGWGKEGTLDRRPFAVAVTDRAKFDEWLAREAESRGANVLEGTSLRGMRRIARGWEVRFDGGILEADYVVGADGAAGKTGLLAGLRSGWTTSELILALDVVLQDRSGDDLVFKMDAVDGGYGWVFPFDGGLNIGVGGIPHPGMDLARALRAHLSWLGEPDGWEARGGVIPVGARRVVAGNRVMLVGDAAGLADPFTGEGIYYAVLSAEVAARSLLRRRGGGDPVRSYVDGMSSVLEEAGVRLKVSKIVLPRIRKFFEIMMVYRPIAEKFTDYAIGKISFSGFWRWAKRRLPLAWLKTLVSP